MKMGSWRNSAGLSLELGIEAEFLLRSLAMMLGSLLMVMRCLFVMLDLLPLTAPLL